MFWWKTHVLHLICHICYITTQETILCLLGDTFFLHVLGYEYFWKLCMRSNPIPEIFNIVMLDVVLLWSYKNIYISWISKQLKSLVFFRPPFTFRRNQWWSVKPVWNRGSSVSWCAELSPTSPLSSPHVIHTLPGSFFYCPTLWLSPLFLIRLASLPVDKTSRDSSSRQPGMVWAQNITCSSDSLPCLPFLLLLQSFSSSTPVF